MYEQAVSGEQRTNNVVEGYRSKFQKLIVVHHANLWRFIEELKKEEHDVINKYEKSGWATATSSSQRTSGTRSATRGSSPWRADTRTIRRGAISTRT